MLLSYCAYDRGSDTYTNAWNAGHAVTLVNELPDTLLVHDPAHYDYQTGRKILTSQVITSGTWVAQAGSAPVTGLLLLSGSLLDAPPNASVMLIGRRLHHHAHESGHHRGHRVVESGGWSQLHHWRSCSFLFPDHAARTRLHDQKVGRNGSLTCFSRTKSRLSSWVCRRTSSVTSQSILWERPKVLIKQNLRSGLRCKLLIEIFWSNLAK